LKIRASLAARPKGAKNKNPRADRGSKRTKKKIALPKESADVPAKVANEANEGCLTGWYQSDNLALHTLKGKKLS
jgi:hypothetical protein